MTQTASPAFWKDMSSEKSELFNDVDILLTYGPADPTPLKEAIKADALLSRIPAIAKDRVVFLGQDALSASANPSPLSIPWGIEKYSTLVFRRCGTCRSRPAG